MKKEYEIIDDFLDPQDYQDINSTLLPTIGQPASFPWYWVDGKTVTREGGESGDYSNFQFVHILQQTIPEVSKSAHFPIVLPILHKMNDVLALVRIKINLETNKGVQLESGFHWDYHSIFESEQKKEMPYPTMHVAIFYVNTNNGYTELENGAKIESVANRLLIFPNTMQHRGVSQNDEKRRCVINFNYVKNGLTSGG